MKKCVAVGDLFVTPNDLSKGLAPLSDLGFEVEVIDFGVEDYDALQAMNHQVEQDGPSCIPLPNHLLDRLRQAHLIVVHFCPVSAQLLAECEQLEAIGTCRTGMSNIDVDAAEARGIPVINCRGRLANAVADFTVGIMICEARNIARGHHALMNGEWRRTFMNLGNIPELPGKTVGLIGLGAIGQATAKRLSGFEVKILAYDPFVEPAMAEALDVQRVDLCDLMSHSDFVSLHVDLRPETSGMITRELLLCMKPTAYLINTARAGIVDEQALIEILANGNIAGAAIDVFETEPLGSEHPLLQLDNVTLTPHMAGGSDDAFRRCPQLLCEHLCARLASN